MLTVPADPYFHVLIGDQTKLRPDFFGARVRAGLTGASHGSRDSLRMRSLAMQRSMGRTRRYLAGTFILPFRHIHVPLTKENRTRPTKDAQLNTRWKDFLDKLPEAAMREWWKSVSLALI